MLDNTTKVNSAVKPCEIRVNLRKVLPDGRGVDPFREPLIQIMSGESRKPRIFFAAGPGNVIQAHRYWRRGVADPGQMSSTFSGEFEAFCQQRGLDAYLIAAWAPRDRIVDGQFTIEHRPKASASGIGY